MKKMIWELTLYFCACAVAVALVLLVKELTPDRPPAPSVKCECVCPKQ